MKVNAPLISVIIPHLNQLEHLGDCLASLEAQSLDRALFEIIVVDNGSSPPPDRVIGHRAGVRLFHEKQPGPGPARNTGIRYASGEVLALIDADCRAHPDWLQNALQNLQASPEGTILGGDVRIWHDGEVFTAIEAYESVFAYRFKLYIEQHGFSGTGNLVVRRSDFAKIGPFAGINFAEDMEWGQRACRAGFKFRYIPEMIVFHPARRSLHELCLKWDRQIQHYLNMEQEQGKRAWKVRWVCRAVAVLGSPIIDLAKILDSDRIEGAPARFKAMIVLVAIRAHRARKMLSLLRASKTVVWNRSVGA
jgi:glycosyltransferase involved in cell wall biosynthesis